MAHILVVDDEAPVRRVLGRLMHKAGHECLFAGDAIEAEQLLAERTFEVVLSDVNMPGPKGTGLHLARHIRERFPDVALITVTGVDDPVVADELIEHGTYAYLIKPFEPSEILIAVKSALRRRTLEIEARQHREELEQRVVERTLALTQAEAELRLSREETIQRVAHAVEFRDNLTGEHIQRMSRYCALLGTRLGLDATAADELRLASSLHDVGKVGIPDAVLQKPGPLTEAEFAVMKTHTVIGFEILSGSKSELLRLASVIAVSHHERYDGTGYPRGLRGADIPLHGRIVAVADVFDAMTSARVYRGAEDPQAVLRMIQEQRGMHFDPDIVDAFVACFDEVLAIHGEFVAGEPQATRTDLRALVLPPRGA